MCYFYMIFVSSMLTIRGVFIGVLWKVEYTVWLNMLNYSEILDDTEKDVSESHSKLLDAVLQLDKGQRLYIIYIYYIILISYFIGSYNYNHFILNILFLIIEKNI